MGSDCAWYNDDWGCCSVSAVGVYHQMREAATDAAVEVIKAYNGDDSNGRYHTAHGSLMPIQDLHGL